MSLTRGQNGNHSSRLLAETRMTVHGIEQKMCKIKGFSGPCTEIWCDNITL
jgi:hypothetical protein